MVQLDCEEELAGDLSQLRLQKKRSQEAANDADGQQEERGPETVLKERSRGIPRGTLGTKGNLGVNLVKIDLSKMPTVAYQYDISITPERPKKLMRCILHRFNQIYFKDHAMAYDGCKCIYTPSKLPVARLEKTVDVLDEGGRKLTFTVTIKETDALEVDLNCLKCYQKERIYDKPMKALQCLEVILATPCHSKGVRAGRAFYTQPAEFYNLYDGFEMWTGLFQAAILGDEPFLNVDISHKSFPVSCTVLKYLKSNYRIDNFNQGLKPCVAESLENYLTSMLVVYDPPICFKTVPRVYKVNGIAKPASCLYFKNEENIEISVAKYYQSRGFGLMFPHLNCVHVGAIDRTIYIPIELLRVSFGQTLTRKNDTRQVQQMIHYAATSTDERKSKIMDILTYFAHNSNEIIRKFGISIGASFIEVPMRVLKPPHLEYFAGHTILPSNGVWRVGNTTKFLLTMKPIRKHKWAIVYGARSRMNIFVVGNFSKMVLRVATRMNMSLHERPTIMTFSHIDDTLRETKADQYDLVIVILPPNGTTYAEVKQSAELRHGIVTQCVKEMTIERRLDEHTIFNLMLKVNAKLNGTNHKIAANPIVELKNIMFMGGDVTHPSPDQRDMPSVVGVVATHDDIGARYNLQYRVQKSTVETIEDMDSIVTHLLKMYFLKQKRYPDHIIYYRDGVSDGQFPIVKQIELTGIRAACDKMHIKPKLTCIVVVKRHHIRFFPKSKPERSNKFNNVTPGTVVDQVIVHPNEVQFFLVSHQSIQGTARPTRYNVIVDEANMDIDVIQNLTNHLCHMFPRCNRAVSYPAPVFLAHLVATRGRVYLEGFNLTASSDLEFEYTKRKINWFLLQNNAMYFV